MGGKENKRKKVGYILNQEENKCFFVLHLMGESAISVYCELLEATNNNVLSGTALVLLWCEVHLHAWSIIGKSAEPWSVHSVCLNLYRTTWLLHHSPVPQVCTSSWEFAMGSLAGKMETLFLVPWAEHKYDALINLSYLFCCFT